MEYNVNLVERLFLEAAVAATAIVIRTWMGVGDVGRGPAQVLPHRVGLTWTAQATIGVIYAGPTPIVHPTRAVPVHMFRYPSEALRWSWSAYSREPPRRGGCQSTKLLPRLIDLIIHHIPDRDNDCKTYGEVVVRGVLSPSQCLTPLGPAV